jgi:hypothetical protein
MFVDGGYKFWMMNFGFWIRNPRGAGDQTLIEANNRGKNQFFSDLLFFQPLNKSQSL